MFHLLRYGLLLFALLQLHTVAQAQAGSNQTAQLVKAFAWADTGKAAAGDGKEYLLCGAAAGTMKQWQQEGVLNLHRQLGDSVFIISLHKGVADTGFTRQCRWIKKANAYWKLSPPLLQQHHTGQWILPAALFVAVKDEAAFSNKANHQKSQAAGSHLFIATVNSGEELQALLLDSNVYFMAACHAQPKEELQINNLDLGVNAINGLHSRYPRLNGDSIHISIKENLPDTTDIDLAARYQNNPLAAVAVTVHASIMATMAAGAGNSWYLGRGVAGAATISSSNFSNLLPDDNANYLQQQISVQNHSYGVGVENFYGADAAAFDASALLNDSLLFVFSAGNSGNTTLATGYYSGLAAHANLTGSFKMAKNIITAGAVDSFGVVATASSRGPAYDGRVKPELVAYGEDGTSGAAALISGTAAVLQQAYKQANGGRLPSSALIKALLINSAEDVGPAGIDFTSGYGNLNALKAVENLQAGHYFSGTVTDNGSRAFSLPVPANTSKVTITLVWNDAPAPPNAYRALVNDLDMELQLPATSGRWQPWVLNSAAAADSLALLPVRKRDSLNTVEQVTVQNPAAGNYTIVVKGFSVSTAAQPFYIAYQLDTVNALEWRFPVAADNVFPAAANMLRWHTDMHTANASLLYSIDNGSNWQLISNTINTSQSFYAWHAPDTNVLAILKMEVGTASFLSDTFTISKKLAFKTGFNCADSVLWYWNKLPGIDGYRVFSLQGRQLQPVATVRDTQFVFNKANLPYQQFAVAPVINGRVGVKSYTANYTEQGVDCYINYFIADLQDDTAAKIQLQLGTTYFIQRLVFEKLQQGNFVGLYTVAVIDGAGYSVMDRHLQKGLNVYRVRIELADGRIIYSNITSVFYFDAAEVVVFPNPVEQRSTLTVQLKELQNQVIQIRDVLGRIVFDKQVSSMSVNIAMGFSKGLYFISVYNPETKQRKVVSMVVQ